MNSVILFPKKSIYLLFLFIVAVLYVLLFSTATSPLVEIHPVDSSMFISMGRMLIDGLTPYVEFFDHKGPIIFFIQGLGQFFAPYRAGAFILETLNMFLLLLMIDKLLRLFFKDERIILSIIYLSLLFLTQTLGRGNFTEEYSLVPMLGSLYIGCKYFFLNQKISKTQGLLLGLCFSFFVWLRINNGGILYAVILAMFITTIWNKDYASLKNLVLYTIVGSIPLTLIILVYFYSQGALYDLFYGTFLFNLKYAGKPPMKLFHKNLWINIFAILLVGYGTYLHYKKEKNTKVFLFSGLILILSYFSVNVAYLYTHYFILFLPAILYGFILLFSFLTKEKTIRYVTLSIVIFFAINLIVKGFLVYNIYDKSREETKVYRQLATELMNQIPATEIAETYYYNIEPKFYTILEVNTNYKYFVLQEWMGQNDPEVLDEINQTITSANQPLWILIQRSDKDVQDINDKMKIILDKDYILQHQNDKFQLYKLN